MTIQDNYKKVLEKIQETCHKYQRNPKEVQLVVVSKNQTAEQIQAIYDLGHKDFGENRVQEALNKREVLPKDIHWHFIGSIQKNKVNKIIPGFCLIHSLDNLLLAEKLAKVSEQNNVTTSALLQVNISKEETKQGFSKDECLRLFETIKTLPHLSIKGLMTMAPYHEKPEKIAQFFSELRELKETLEQKFALYLPHLSMGMSEDFSIAIAEGATIVRIGSSIFKD